MITITSSVSEEMNKDLTFVAEKLDRSKSYIVKAALKAYLQEQLEDIEDYNEAMEILAKNEPTIAWEDVKRECGLLED